MTSNKAMTSNSWLATGVAALMLACCCGLATVAIWWFFVRTAVGQQLDEMALAGAKIGARFVAGQSSQLLEYVSIAAVAVAMVTVAVIGAVRRRWLLAAAAAAVIAAANVTTQVLKSLVFTRTELLSWHAFSSGNTLPSGHATAASAAAVAALMVAPRRLRPVFALVGAAVMFAFGYATIVLQWHRPTDVLAAYCVCLGWGFAALATIAFKRAIWGVGGHELDTEPRGGLPWLSKLMGLAGVVLLGVGSFGMIVNHPLLPVEELARSVLFAAYVSAVLVIAGSVLLGMGLLLAITNLVEALPPARST